ncbi:MAG: hypothetical protein ACRC1J_02225 [Sandaracinobacteroides sp.]
MTKRICGPRPGPLRAGCAALLALLLPGQSVQAGPLELGVNTHFSQGWPALAWPLLEGLPVSHVRDAVRWQTIETVRGRHDFTPAATAHIDRICAAGRRVVLTLPLAHPLYDGGTTVYTPAGRAAVASFARAQAVRFGACVAGFEIGNEINSRANFNGPAAADVPGNYVAIVRAVKAAVKPVAPDIRLYAGSTNAVGTGFLARLFAAGLLAEADAIAIHPYRQDAANIDWELERLFSAMAQHGKPLPVAATEFSFPTSDETEAADFLVKMLVMMRAGGVAEAHWYSLIDYKFFPTMGLFTSDSREKKVGASLRYFANSWNRAQLPVRLNIGQPSLFHFRLAPDLQIVWGSPRSLTVTGTATYRDSSGAVIQKPSLIGDAPVFIEGPAVVTPRAPRVLADSLLDYGRPIWSYWGQKGSAAALKLEPVDWTWASFISHPTLRPAVFNQRSLMPGGTSQAPVTLGLGWVATAAQPVRAIACLRRQTTLGDGVRLVITRNAQIVAETVVAAAPQTLDLPISVSRGDVIEFRVDPNAGSSGDMMAYRFQIATVTAEPPTC